MRDVHHMSMIIFFAALNSRYNFVMSKPFYIYLDDANNSLTLT